MTDLRKVLAFNMKLHRKKLGLSQAKLAELIEVSDNYVALIEIGRRFPSLDYKARSFQFIEKVPADFLLQLLGITQRIFTV